ncbi:MAG: hypothetical protein WAN22_28955 [Solirubrobacteraceae bacterium]
MRCRRPLIPTFTIAVAAVAVLAAGCGGGSSPPASSATPAAAGTDLAGNAMAFAACMRSHGLSSYPDPQVSQSTGHVQIRISPGGLDPTSPAFKSATHACGHLLPDGGSPSGAVSPQEQAQDLRYASCMRTHRVTNFPDPDHDGVFTLPSGVDQQAPQFQRATKACANVEPSSLSILNQPPGSS